MLLNMLSPFIAAQYYRNKQSDGQNDSYTETHENKPI